MNVNNKHINIFAFVSSAIYYEIIEEVISIISTLNEMQKISFVCE